MGQLVTTVGGWFTRPRLVMAALVQLILIALAASLLVGATSTASGESPGEQFGGKLNGQRALLTMPSGGGEPKGIVVWFHGQGGTAKNKVDEPFLQALRREGWVIASHDFRATSWGNPGSTADTKALIEWAEERTGLEVKVWVSGSMGGAVSLNALNFGAPAPDCWYGVKPAISLTQMNKVPGGPGYIRSAYGGDVPLERDPVRNVESLPADVRYRVAASKDDHWVLYHQNAGKLIERLAGIGADVTLFEAKGLHMDPSHFDNFDVVQFAESCA